MGLGWLSLDQVPDSEMKVLSLIFLQLISYIGLFFHQHVVLKDLRLSDTSSAFIMFVLISSSFLIAETNYLCLL